jgi:tight adherence protein B
MSVAATVHRLAVLLRAGIPPLPAWRYLAEASAAPAVRAAASVASPDRIAEALVTAAEGEADEAAWRCVAAAWRVATEAGAPLAPTLSRLGDVLHSLDEARREIDVALAGPRATARIMVALPFLGLAGGALLGFDPLATLLGSVPGLCCLAVGLTLLFAGRRWTNRMLAAARDVDPSPGLALDVLAIALSGGASVERAYEVSDEALRRSGLAPVGTAADSLVALSRTAGVPIAALLGGEAQEQRRDARAAIRRRSAELGTRLLLPLGVFLLPSFLALGVAPLLISVLRATATLL